jgi:hypothetical protein
MFASLGLLLILVTPICCSWTSRLEDHGQQRCRSAVTPDAAARVGSYCVWDELARNRKLARPSSTPLAAEYLRRPEKIEGIPRPELRGAISNPRFMQQLRRLANRFGAKCMPCVSFPVPHLRPLGHVFGIQQTVVAARVVSYRLQLVPGPNRSGSNSGLIQCAGRKTEMTRRAALLTRARFPAGLDRTEGAAFSQEMRQSILGSILSSQRLDRYRYACPLVASPRPVHLQYRHIQTPAHDHPMRRGGTSTRNLHDRSPR